VTATLRVGFSPNPRLQPLIDGEVSIPGIELIWEFFNPGELFLKQLRENVFDLFEFSLADFIVTRSRPQFADLGWDAIPIFLSKPIGPLMSLHGNVRSGVRSLADLAGKRLGVPDYGMTAAVWTRIMLRVLYGIQPQDVTWYNGRPPSQRHGRLLDIDSQPANGVRLINLDDGSSTLGEMLECGEIDAAFGSAFGAPVAESENVRCLATSDSLLELLSRLQARANLTPINHTLAIKRRWLLDEPDVAMSIYQAFNTSKRIAYERARGAATAYFLFPQEAFAAQAATFGDDPYPCGLANTRPILETVAEQLCLDGLIPAVPDVDDLFAAAVRAT